MVDLGSSGGFDCFVAAGQVGPEGRVVGVDMTDGMLERSRAEATAMRSAMSSPERGSRNCGQERLGRCVISNGVINSAPTRAVSSTRLCGCCAPGGRLQFADIATGKVVPEAAVQNIDLWTD
jgi:hypothetical protein